MTEPLADRIVRYAAAYAGATGFLQLSSEGWYPTFHPTRPWGLAPDRIVVEIVGEPVTLADAHQAVAERDARVTAAAAHRDRSNAAAWANRAIREGAAAATYGHRSGPSLCPRCNCFKPRPSRTCWWCGDQPGTHNGDPRAFDRARGYA